MWSLWYIAKATWLLKVASMKVHKVQACNHDHDISQKRKKPPIRTIWNFIKKYKSWDLIFCKELWVLFARILNFIELSSLYLNSTTFENVVLISITMNSVFFFLPLSLLLWLRIFSPVHALYPPLSSSFASSLSLNLEFHG